MSYRINRKGLEELLSGEPVTVSDGVHPTYTHVYFDDDALAYLKEWLPKEKADLIREKFSWCKTCHVEPCICKPKEEPKDECKTCGFINCVCTKNEPKNKCAICQREERQGIDPPDNCPACNPKPHEIDVVKEMTKEEEWVVCPNCCIKFEGKDCREQHDRHLRPDGCTNVINGLRIFPKPERDYYTREEIDAQWNCHHNSRVMYQDMREYEGREWRKALLEILKIHLNQLYSANGSGWSIMSKDIEDLRKRFL